MGKFLGKTAESSTPVHDQAKTGGGEAGGRNKIRLFLVPRLAHYLGISLCP